METVIIRNANGPVLINKTDYNADEHGPTYATLEMAYAEQPEETQQPENPGLVPAQPVTHDANSNPVNAGDGGQMIPATNVLRNDGPTVADYVAAGYDPNGYPPSGYASRSTPEEIAAAVAAYVPPQPQDQTPPVEMVVVKKGKKFFAVDKATQKPIEGREGIDAEGYADENTAWIAITRANAPKTA